MEQTKRTIGINSFVLKMTAAVSMLIDHIGAVLFPQYIIFRIIGRIAFPIFAYTLAEGFIYTHDVKKYILRMGALALLSEIPFDLVFFGKFVEFSHQNVFFTLTLGLIMLHLFTKASNRFEKCSTVILMFLLSEFLHCDYSSMGLLMILCFYLYRDRNAMKMGSVAAVNVILMGYVQAFAVLALLPVYFHNREEGPKAKGFFYFFYPVHLLVLFLIRKIL